MRVLYLTEGNQLGNIKMKSTRMGRLVLIYQPSHPPNLWGYGRGESLLPLATTGKDPVGDG